MLDRGNSGVAPSAEILRAIRHGVAAGACRVAWRATGESAWLRTAAEQSRAAERRLHQAALSLVADRAIAD